MAPDIPILFFPFRLTLLSWVEKQFALLVATARFAQEMAATRREEPGQQSAPQA
jgi:hypothetical protein